MKKLIALAPVVALVTACASAPIATPTPAQVQAVQANSQTFKCDNDTEVVALHTTTNDVNFANLKVTSPMLGLNQVALVLKQDVAASGVRYTVSGTNTNYDWHVKGNEAVFSVNHQGKDYNFVCNAL